MSSKIQGIHQASIINRNSIFAWAAVGTGFLLLVPLIGMQVSDEWNWSLSDFVIIGVLVFGMASLFVLAARRWPKHRIIIGIAMLLATLFIWVELAVGIFS